ncbi:sn-glycerol-1-phosphate dehydrogenase [Acetobacterium carbinolicum]|uniref:sn-glycerol-1-phosphate dehydrogenase n=1 Tax=Acetobacterium TaxID=33951 RepID=UPI000DBEAF9D|nr:sn-glycerol-1-phosphate dehydrogenase [Acetobacterium sp. KB-1]AWW27803.1 sn-glycerol-1-phosphate dehydrogenase [Acetobacterium sp. KB-1]
MNEILKMSMNEMAEADFDCSCGRHHSLSIKKIAIGKGVIQQLPDIAAEFKGKQLYMISDNNTWKAAGEQAFKILSDSNFEVKSHQFETGTEILIPDELAMGRMLLEMPLGTALIVAVGSGTLNDMAKYLSSRTGIPYIIVCTAPSMDGYVADGAPLICNGRKISYVATLAYGVVGDTDIMKQAPMHMIHAGLGDVLGKLTALTDWSLAVAMIDEYRCETCVKLVEEALRKCIEFAPALKERNEEAILYLIEALTLTGVTMAIVGVSRPASGSEHLLSHYWEMDFIARHKYPELHGVKVGIATPIVAEIYQLLDDELPPETKALAPQREVVEALLESAGAMISPKEVGIDRDLFYRSLMEANTVRKRYSVFQYAKDKGRLEEIAGIITERIYGK